MGKETNRDYKIKEVMKLAGCNCGKMEAKKWLIYSDWNVDEAVKNYEKYGKSVPKV